MGYALTISAIDSATKMFMIATTIHPHTTDTGPVLIYAMAKKPAPAQTRAVICHFYGLRPLESAWGFPC